MEKLTPITRYNLEHISDALKLILKKDRNVTERDRTGMFFYKVNRKDEPLLIFEVDEDGFIFHDETPSIVFPIGRVFAFDVYVKYVRKGHFGQAFYDILAMYNEKFDYIRVGDKYFRLIPDSDRVLVKPHMKTETVEDVGKENMKELEKFYGFKMMPSNTDYKRDAHGYFNIYQKLPHEPVHCDKMEEIPWSMTMLRHVWGDSFELGIMYMQCLYLHPRQMLPILALVSKENQTGKTTFGNWLNLIYGANATILNANNFKSSFTEAYSDCTYVVIEETKTDNKDVTNLIKQLSTSKKLNVNKKMISAYTQDFYGKFIMTSNHEESFIGIEEEDIRYWVLKIPKLPKESANHNIENDLEAEIPKFLGYLAQLPPLDFTRSRQLFTAEEIDTKWKRKAIDYTHDDCHYDVRVFIAKWFDKNSSRTDLRFEVGDFYDELCFNNNLANKYSKNQVRKTIEAGLGLKHFPKRVRYDKCIGNDYREALTAQGTNSHYCITRAMAEKKGWVEMPIKASPTPTQHFLD